MSRWKFITTAIILFLSIVLVSELGGGVYADAWLDGTPQMYEQARFLSQVLGHEDGVSLAPAIADISPAVYELGDKRDFYATNMISGKQYSLEASARAISDSAYIFVEAGRPVASSKIKSLLTSFDGIYSSLTKQFGSPPDSIDRDPRIYVLLMDILDTPQADGAQVIGYFGPINQYRNADISRWTSMRSNEVEMIYIHYASLNSSVERAESIVAHEFAHMIQWARDPYDDTWVNEGLAVYAESVLGYEVDDRISAFEKNAGVSLLDWSNTVEDYGAAYLFFAYISERFGGVSAITSIMNNRSRGIRGIERALEAVGESVSFHSLFLDWVTANYLDDPELNNGVYGYVTLDIHLRPSNVEAFYPIAQKTFRVNPWAARYTEFRKDQNDALSLTVYEDDETDIVAQLIDFGDETNISPVKSGEVKSGTKLIPPEGREAVLVVTSQPDLLIPGRTYSYGYSAEIQPTVAPVEPTSDRKITTWGALKRK